MARCPPSRSTPSNVASQEQFLAALGETAEAVAGVMDYLLPSPTGPEAKLAEAMRYAVLGGGKRLRAFFAVESSRLFGVSRGCALRVAAAIEFLHGYSLVHDDLPAMDDSDLRRGRPSVHKAFDEATAILAGDALLTLAFEVLAEPDTHADPVVRVELIRRLAQASGARGMVGGQVRAIHPQHPAAATQQQSRCNINNNNPVATSTKTIPLQSPHPSLADGTLDRRWSAARGPGARRWHRRRRERARPR